MEGNMLNQNTINKVRNETYALTIYSAFGNDPQSSQLTKWLVKNLQDIYRYLEPGHFGGKLIVFTMFDDSQIKLTENALPLFDKNILINKTSGIIVLNIAADESIAMWENIDTEFIFKDNRTLVYCYNAQKEYFFANSQKIDIQKWCNSPSIFSLQYHFLNDALERYKTDKILHSSCEIFKKCWQETNRIFFINGPEETMQISLKEYLTSLLREVDIVREYNLGASKPVDIRVYFKEANRAALIELKWLGKSKGNDGEISTEYSNSRAVDGVQQLKDYLDLSNTDTPTCITKAYLVVIDGRRKGTAKDTTDINVDNGLYYQNVELEIPVDKQYHHRIKNFEKPIRIFCEPICK